MDYDNARVRTILRRLVGALAGRRDHLVSLVDAKEGMTCNGQLHLGLREVPMEAITGSVGRSLDFAPDFSPVTTHTRGRWESVDRAMSDSVPLPPVSLYKLGDFYFVGDGHHRISVARHRGATYVDAVVTEFCPVPHDTPATQNNIEAAASGG